MSDKADNITLMASGHLVPMTRQVYMAWVNAVKTGQTELGLREWAQAIPLDEYLAMHGSLVIQPRDERLLPGISGELQVSMWYDPDSVSVEKLRDMWVRVSDDRAELERAAIARIALNFMRYEGPRP